MKKKNAIKIAVKLISAFLVTVQLGEEVPSAEPVTYMNRPSGETLAVESIFTGGDEAKQIEIKLALLIRLIKEDNMRFKDFKYKIPPCGNGISYVIDLENKTGGTGKRSWDVPCMITDDRGGLQLNVKALVKGDGEVSIVYPWEAEKGTPSVVTDISPDKLSKPSNGASSAVVLEGTSTGQSWVKNFIYKALTPSNMRIIVVIIATTVFGILANTSFPWVLKAPYFVNTAIYFFLSELISQTYERIKIMQ
ncbi:MAG: hypothetical protein HQL30_01855 [Candidatus Omnitrophica bacterium]|nr:hypothetical protein [Candidatus Omnitrophota bacterium]